MTLFTTILLFLNQKYVNEIFQKLNITNNNEETLSFLKNDAIIEIEPLDFLKIELLNDNKVKMTRKAYTTAYEL